MSHDLAGGFGISHNGGVSAPKVKAQFIDPTLQLRTERLPEGPEWSYEIKLDGYRALAIKPAGGFNRRSWVTCMLIIILSDGIAW